MNDTEENEDVFGAEEGEEVEVFHRVNRLKIKAGGDEKGGLGKIDRNAIERAELVIETKASLYPDEVKSVLESLTESWAQVQSEEEEIAWEAKEQMYHYANQVKDLASTFGYPLMQHFGLSLREFIEKLDIHSIAHKTIVQAHIDVMWVTFHAGLKDHGDEKAEELKQIVAVAIDKYS